MSHVEAYYAAVLSEEIEKLPLQVAVCGHAHCTKTPKPSCGGIR
jgi:hypothetical protein